jgi:hypothetical protein
MQINHPLATVNVDLNEICYEDVEWVKETQESGQGHSVNMIMNLRFHKRLEISRPSE